jgi:hypothetical protein
MAIARRSGYNAVNEVHGRRSVAETFGPGRELLTVVSELGSAQEKLARPATNIRPMHCCHDTEIFASNNSTGSLCILYFVAL